MEREDFELSRKYYYAVPKCTYSTIHSHIPVTSVPRDGGSVCAVVLCTVTL